MTAPWQKDATYKTITINGRERRVRVSYDVPKKMAENLRKNLGVPPNTPVRFTQEPIGLDTIPKDSVGAKPNDGFNCHGCHAAARIYDYPKGMRCEIRERIAAIPVPIGRNKWEVLVGAIKTTTRAKIKHFDKTRQLPTTRFEVEALPTSWHPEVRALYAENTTKRQAKGVARKYKKKKGRLTLSRGRGHGLKSRFSELRS